MSKRAVLVGTTVALCLLGATVAAANDYDQLAQSLATLRAEVESLSGQLADEKSELRDQVRSLSRQKSELSMELDREQIKLQKLRQTISQKRETVEQEQAKSKALVPTFESVANSARAYIQGSLPFRIEERLAEVAKVEDQLKAGLLSPQKAISRIWTVLEDEFRMTRDSGTFRQTIEVEGKEQLAEVVRIGMVMLYYRTSENTVGQAVKTDSGWTFKSIDDPEDVKLVLGLFDSFKKQIRQGYFELPGTLAAVTK